MNFRSTTILLAIITSGFAQAQLTVDNTQTPAQLVQNVLLGGGVTASNITFNGGSATVLNEQIGSFVATATNLGLGGGVIMGSGDVNVAIGPNTQTSATLGGGNFGFNDPDLDQLSNVNTNDAAILEFDFVPTGDSLKFRYVFSSEEYDEYVCGTVNDAFGFFLSGPGITGPFTNNAINIALVPGTNVPVSINTVNNGSVGSNGDVANCSNLDPNWQANSVYFVSNNSGTTIEFDGMTVVLTARALVQCGQTYHIKLAIADGGDTAFDSGVFLEENSFASTGQVIPSLTTSGLGVSANDTTMFEGCGIIPFNFHRMGDTTNTDTVQLVIGGTATPGVDYYPPIPTQLIYQPGDTLIIFPLTVPLDADGLETFTLQVTENIVCSGQTVISNYTFYIDQYADLNVVTTDVSGLCEQDYDIGPTVTQGAGYYGYLWSTGETTPTINVQVDTTTTFYVTVTDTCSLAPVQDSITVSIPNYPPLQVTVSPDVAIPCLETDDISVTSTVGGNSQYTYEWTLNGQSLSATTTINVPAGPPLWYVLTVEEGCGHSAQDSVLVTTVPLPAIEVQNWDSTVFCIGDSVVLYPLGVTGGNGVYTYSWTNGAGTILSNTDSLLVGVPADSAYVLHVQDQCGSIADSVFTTLIPRYDPFLISLTADSTICSGDSITLWAQVTGGSGVYTFDWEGWDWSDPKYTYGGDADATFTVDVLDQCGEGISAVSKVTVQHPEAHILIDNQGEDDWLFQARTVPFVVPVMIWDLGDGTKVKATSTTHSYLDLEDHWVMLHIVSDEGCKAVDSLLVIAPGTLYFPNAFTPDGDGINETFGPIGAAIDEFKMTIFDRWGHVVYESESMDQPWDGKVNGGADAVSGVYVYLYRAKGHYFEADKRYGHVTLVRGSNGR